ncbi:MAG: TolC family protein [Bacteroidales bacterium]
MKIKSIYLNLIFLILASPAFTQAKYGLKECISVGLDRNFSIRIARNNETVSDNNYTIGNAGFLPSLGLTGRYSGAVTNTTQNMKDGTTNETTGTLTNSANAGASLSLTIFNGFSVQTTYKKLYELKQLGELNTQLTIETYIANVVSVYNNYIQQLQLLSNLEYAVRLSRERLRIDEERYLLRSGSKLQVLQSKVYLNSDSSRLSRQKQVLCEAHIRLNELMSVEDIGSNFMISDSSIIVNSGLDYKKLLEETLSGNISLQIARKNQQVSAYDYKLAIARSYPYLDLNGGYSYTLSANSTAAYSNQLSGGPTFGLTMGVNLFDGFNARRQIRNAAIDVQNKELRYDELEQAIRADLLAIYSSYQNNLKLIRMEEQNMSTATENLSIAQEKYKLGNLSGLELREVQKSLLDAAERLLSVQYQAKLAEISLLQITGKIMEYYR